MRDLQPSSALGWSLHQQEQGATGQLSHSPPAGHGWSQEAVDGANGGITPSAKLSVKTSPEMTFILVLPLSNSVVLVVKNRLPMQEMRVPSLGSISWLGRSPEGGHGNPLQYSCLENPMGRGAWRATVHKVTKNRA